ncbi:MAG: TatD family hydrolase, partial [Planctomycetes bacterium]|nr:TatD family hydrolase [Planctomycetota bacterium]
MIDSHCHLHLLREEVGAVLKRAREAGVGGVVQVATDVESARWGRDLSRSGLPIPVWATAGLYPSRAAGSWREELVHLRALLEEGGFCALGEIGLDY